MISFVILGAAIVLWWITLKWEWNIPQFIQTGLIRGQNRFLRNQPYQYIWRINQADLMGQIKKVKDTEEKDEILEIKEIKLRRTLIQLEKEKGIQVELELQICSNLDQSHHKILERRFDTMKITSDECS